MPGPHGLGRPETPRPYLVRGCADGPGVTVQPIKEINGDAEFCQEFLDEVEVPADEVVGEVNQGWAVAQTMLLHERSSGNDNPDYGVNIEDGIDRQVIRIAERAGRLGDPVGRQLVGQIHATDWARQALGKRVIAMMRHSDKSPAGIAAYWKLSEGTYEPLRARWQMDSERACPWSGGRAIPRERERDSTTSTAGSGRSPAAPTRCSATASASGCSGYPES